MNPVRVEDGLMPSLTVSMGQLPQINAWRVGGRYRLVLDVEQTSKGSDTASFRVLSIKPAETTTSKDAILEVMAEKAKQS